MSDVGSQQPGADAMPRDDEPGGESTPLDTSGDGPVGLEDRVRTDDKSAPATNQGKAEPMPVTPTHPDPDAPLDPPPLESMNVGSADPQAPRHPAAAGSGLAVDGDVDPGPQSLGGKGVAPSVERPTPDLQSSTGRGAGPGNPRQDTGGQSHRVPGLLGRTGPDEAVETDVDTGAAQMGPAGPSSDPTDGTPGHSHGVPVPSSDALLNSSEEHAIVRGARTPEPGRS